MTLKTDLFGEEQPERIFLTAYQHCGDVSWEQCPEEDSDDFQAVEYIRADKALTLPLDGDVVERIRAGVSWIEPPFVDDKTTHEELQNRVKFCIADINAALSSIRDR